MSKIRPAADDDLLGLALPSLGLTSPTDNEPLQRPGAAMLAPAAERWR